MQPPNRKTHVATTIGGNRYAVLLALLGKENRRFGDCFLAANAVYEGRAGVAPDRGDNG